jgi:hypothetical protein
MHVEGVIVRAVGDSQSRHTIQRTSIRGISVPVIDVRPTAIRHQDELVRSRGPDGVDYCLDVRKPNVGYHRKIVRLIHYVKHDIWVSQEQRGYFGPDIGQMWRVQKAIPKDALRVRIYLDTSRIESVCCVSVVVVQIDDNQPTLLQRPD